MNLTTLNTKAENILLNWDDEINPTPMSDMASNLAVHIAAWYGYGLNNVNVNLTLNAVAVDVKSTSSVNSLASFPQQSDEANWQRLVSGEFTQGMGKSTYYHLEPILKMGAYTFFELMFERFESNTERFIAMRKYDEECLARRLNRQL